MIISIEGFKGVGKSTLISELKRRHPDYFFITSKERNEYIKRYPLRNIENHEQKFYEMQKVLTMFLYESWQEIASHKIAVLDRGPEELLFYTYNYPAYYGKDWDVEMNLCKEIAYMKKMKSNKIIFLTASDQVIQARKIADDKIRISGGNNEFLSSKALKDFFREFEYTSFIHTDNLTVEEVADTFLQGIQK